MKTGTLYIIPSAISDDRMNISPQYVLDIINTLDEFVVENEKTARGFLKKVGIKIPISDLILHPLNEHTDEKEVSQLLTPLLSGKNIGLISEAGCPAVADPGANLICLAHEKNIKVIPLVGPSSILLSLMASGLNGQNFSFAGYLPKEKNARIKALKDLERIAFSKNQTQIFIEAPYRNQHLLEDILSACDKSLHLCIACEITGNNEFIKTKTVEDWKKNIPNINKRPTVFLVGK